MEPTTLARTSTSLFVRPRFGVFPTSPTVADTLSNAAADMLPMVHPNDLVISGWDISAHNLSASMTRAKVLPYDLQRQVGPLMEDIKPLPSVYYPDFIAANQEERADNVIPGQDKKAHLEQIRKDIRDFKVRPY